MPNLSAVQYLQRTRRDLVEGFCSLESAATRTGLRINQNKTKYMAMNARRLLDPLILEIGPYTFEHVHTFTYLGSKISKENDITEEVQNTIAAANRCYFSLQQHLKSNFIFGTTKTLLYKTLVRPIVLYGVECWTLSRTNEKMVDVFKSKILQRIYDPIKDRDQWRCRINKEVYDIFKEPRLSTVIRIARLQCSGHVEIMDKNSMPRRLMYVQPEGLRKVGRPCARWKDEVGKDARTTGLRSWWATAMNREEWRKLLKEAKTLYEL
jgi:hypothetical protein